MSNKLTTPELVQRLAMFFAAVDTLQEAHLNIEGLPFYRHELKPICRKLLSELDKVQAQVMQESRLADVAYTTEWLTLKQMASVYVNAVLNTTPENLPELFAVLNAYISGGITIVNEPLTEKTN